MLFFVSCMASDKPQSKPDRCLPQSLTGTFFRHAVKSIGEQKTHIVNGDVGSLYRGQSCCNNASSGLAVAACRDSKVCNGASRQ